MADGKCDKNKGTEVSRVGVGRVVPDSLSNFQGGIEHREEKRVERFPSGSRGKGREGGEIDLLCRSHEGAILRP